MNGNRHRIAISSQSRYIYKTQLERQGQNHEATEAKQKQKRETQHIFDLTIKYLLQKTSPANTVSLVNTLFDRRYALDSKVDFATTEDVAKHGNTLDLFRADILLSVAGDGFAIEFQVGHDEIIGLRVFEYGFGHAHRTKRVSGNGELIEIELPDACVVYFENTKTTPGQIIFRLTSKDGGYFDYKVRIFKMEEQSLESLEQQRLLVLLPFCLMWLRKELKQGKATAAERLATAEKERRMLCEIEDVLIRALDNGILGTRDGIMIVESISQMHEELYGTYPEFQEADMVTSQRIKLRWAYYEEELIRKAEAKLEKSQSRIFDLLKQGYTVDEVEKLLTQERDQEAAASQDVP